MYCCVGVGVFCVGVCELCVVGDMVVCCVGGECGVLCWVVG